MSKNILARFLMLVLCTTLVIVSSCSAFAEEAIPVIEYDDAYCEHLFDEPEGHCSINSQVTMKAGEEKNLLFATTGSPYYDTGVIIPFETIIDLEDGFEDDGEWITSEYLNRVLNLDRDRYELFFELRPPVGTPPGVYEFRFLEIDEPADELKDTVATTYSGVIITVTITD